MMAANNRTVSGVLRKCVFIVSLCCLCWAGIVGAQKPQADYLMYVGSYTNTTAKGIYAWWFDTARGALSPIGLVAEAVYPAQLWAAPNGRYLYAANWQGSDTTPGDTITAYAINRETGALTFLNKVGCGGSGPNQVVVDPSGKVAVAVNYRSGSVAAFGIEPDGRLSEAFYIDQHAGQPQPPSRQPGPRAHGVEFSHDSRFAYVADIGIDRVYSYRLDTAKRSMTPFDPPYVQMPPGSGPRRLQLHPNGRFLYLLRETDSMVTVFAVNGGALREVQTLSALPADYTGNNTTAEIQIDKAGTFLYTSNRGHDTITVFRIDPANGTLSVVEYMPAGGRTPRNFTLGPTPGYLVTSNQNGENLVVFRVDPSTGRLTQTSEEAKLANPGSIFFVKAR
jgi:6-phosphogluconolactonase